MKLDQLLIGDDAYELIIRYFNSIVFLKHDQVVELGEQIILSCLHPCDFILSLLHQQWSYLLLVICWGCGKLNAFFLLLFSFHAFYFVIKFHKLSI
jgi:hypothetical protein